MILASTARNLKARENNPSLEEQIIQTAREGKNSLTLNRLFTKEEKDVMISLGYKVDDTVVYVSVISW